MMRPTRLFVAPYGGRTSVGSTPPDASLMTFCVRSICDRTSADDSEVSCGWDQLWSASSWPSRAIRRTTSRWLPTFSPSMKKVARTPSFFSVSSRPAV
ncbi:Uncharacterised protein [Mycobacterium tuberculosis]|nr:Uncharacterised protein [Mycobacterium tuberculosis]